MNQSLLLGRALGPSEREGRRPLLNVPVTQPLVFLPACHPRLYVYRLQLRQAIQGRLDAHVSRDTNHQFLSSALRRQVSPLPSSRLRPRRCIVCACNSELSFALAAKDATVSHPRGPPVPATRTTTFDGPLRAPHATDSRPAWRALGADGKTDS